MKLAQKTFCYGIIHFSVATLVAYALTGNFAISLGIGLIEPTIQTLIYPVYEKFWQTYMKKS